MQIWVTIFEKLDTVRETVSTKETENAMKDETKLKVPVVRGVFGIDESRIHGSIERDPQYEYIGKDTSRREELSRILLRGPTPSPLLKHYW